jgi:hypothetical protein
MTFPILLILIALLLWTMLPTPRNEHKPRRDRRADDAPQ